MAKKTKKINGKVYYQQYFAIRGKASDPETWKLPHHTGGQGDRAHDELAVDWGRVGAALVAVESGQFRGQRLGATMAERKRAGRHLAAHYRKAKKDVPEGLRKFLGKQEVRGRGQEAGLMARRRIGKGRALTELVKGSLNYTMDQIRKAFYRQFKGAFEPGMGPWVTEVFADYVIVDSDDLEIDEYYRVTYERRDGEYVFAARDDWEIVELTYRLQTVSEARGRGQGAGRMPAVRSGRSDNGRTRKRFVERVAQRVELLEGEDGGEGGPRRIRAVGITADVINANGRRYPRAVLAQAVEELRGHLHESAGQGRLKQVLGEAEHPSDKPTQYPNLLETVVKWAGVDLPGDRVILEGQLLDTSKGRDVKALIEGGVQIGVSQRAWGKAKVVREGDNSVEEVTELHITGYDFVLDPSDPNGGIEAILESRRNRAMDFEEFLRALREEGIFDGLASAVRDQIEEAQREQSRARQERMLREALGAGPDEDLVEAARRLADQREQAGQRPAGNVELERVLRAELGIGETDDLQEALRQREARRRELEEAEQARRVAAYIDEQVGQIKYPEWMKDRFVEAVKGTSPKTEDEAKKAIVEKRKEYDALMAEFELRTRGYGVQVLGPVIEREFGVPQFASVAHKLNESLARAGHGQVRKWNRGLHEMTVNERFAKALLELFDQEHQRELLAEARLFEEAEQTSDLSLPYSVSRAVIAEAVPNLVAASIFDVGTTPDSEFYLYYEAYSAETGGTGTVTDESVTIAALATWYALDYKRVQPGTVTVTSDPAGTTYTEGTDYAIDYANGKILAITGGGISASDGILVDYTYDAIRLGENTAIQRGKESLSRVLVSSAADRLAAQITDEAIQFARAQIGWDAVGRTLSNLVRQIREKIDQGMMYLGLGKALSVASNSGGTWSATPAGGDTYQENLDKLFRYLGVAKVKVANRYYEPNFILASVTNSDLMSNSQQFTQAGQRPDADLNAAGYVGRAKGLPTFESPLFSDSWILVGNRELVMYRVFRAMMLKGPYPSYDVSGGTSKLIAADQYYAEEYNVTEAPVANKGSFVKITS